MGEEPTGNARAQSYRHRPLVRMTSTVIEPGTSSFEEMLAETKEGIFCKDCCRAPPRTSSSPLAAPRPG